MEAIRERHQCMAVGSLWPHFIDLNCFLILNRWVSIRDRLPLEAINCTRFLWRPFWEPLQSNLHFIILVLMVQSAITLIIIPQPYGSPTVTVVTRYTTTGYPTGFGLDDVFLSALPVLLHLNLHVHFPWNEYIPSSPRK